MATKKASKVTKVRWTDPASVRAAIAAKADEVLAADMRGSNLGVQKTLSALTPAELEKLAALDPAIAQEMARAAYAICMRRKFDAGIAIYDAIADSAKLDDLEDPTIGVNATWHLARAPKPLRDAKRVARYASFFEPISAINPVIWLNIATLQVEIGDPKAAVLSLKKALVLGDFITHAKLGTAPMKSWKKYPGFKDLAKVEPEYPFGLRALQQWAMHDDARARRFLRKLDLEAVYGTFEHDASALYPGVDDKDFDVFGTSFDGALWAFWRRKKNAKVSEMPVVVFGSDGFLGVYADSLDAMLCLFVHGWTLSDVEELGFNYSNEAWSPPKTLSKLKADGTLRSMLSKIAPAAMKLDATKARAAAIALMPDFIEAVKKNARPQKEKKKVAKKKSTARPRR